MKKSSNQLINILLDQIETQLYKTEAKILRIKDQAITNPQIRDKLYQLQQKNNIITNHLKDMYYDTLK